MTAATIFVDPIEMGSNHTWLGVPVCAVMAPVYKTIRARHLKDLPLQVLGLRACMPVALIVLGLALFLRIWPACRRQLPVLALSMTSSLTALSFCTVSQQRSR